MKKTYYKLGAAMTVGMLVSVSGEASAAAAAAGANNFSKIAQNITTSTASIPGLLTGLAYLFGILLGVLGILKIKDHVENPGQTPLKEGAIRLACGGALFALPIVYSAMFETIGTSSSVGAAALKQVKFNVL
jgi:hypothetical protein